MVPSMIYHVSPAGNGWAVETENGSEREGPYAEKATALRHGQEMARARRAALVVHREDGSIHAEHRY